MDAASRSASATARPSYPHTSPIPLSKRTSSRNALNKTYLDGVGSPPSIAAANRQRTQKGKGKEPAHIPVPKRREQIKQEERVVLDSQRHSHGLSWSSVARDSVVDNLLQSLGNLSGQNLPDMDNVRDDEFDREKFRIPDLPQLASFSMSRPTSRPRGHTYSSSLSSGYDGYGTVAADSPSSRYSQSTKGRRSNSSSNFRLPNGVNSKVHPALRPTGINRTSSDTQRHVGTAGDAKTASSDIGSVEDGYGSMMERNNRPNMSGRRSLSMNQIDHIYAEPAYGSSILERGRPVPSVFSKYEQDDDAAPEPAVPAGPRKKENPRATGPVYVNPASSKQSNLRKVNTQSDLRSANRPNPPVPQYIQEQASDFARLNSMRGAPAMSLTQESAPNPSYRTARRDAPSPQRERPGFFKRVFGSSSRSASALSERGLSERGLSERSETQESLGYLDKAAPPTRSQSNENAVQTRQSSRERAPPTQPPMALNKKTSFFRRRKKSAADSAPVPALPPNPASNLDRHRKRQPSPSVSSLQQVMDPYLTKDGTPVAITPNARHDDSSRPTTQDSITENSDDPDMFHSGYTPPPDASLGRRDPLRRTLSESRKGKDSSEHEESPRMRIKVKDRVPHAVEPPSQQTHEQHYLGASSFLHDASRETSTATIGEHFTPPFDHAKVSPLTEVPPNVAEDEYDDQRPVSRASTGDRIIASRSVTPFEPETKLRSFSDGAIISKDSNDEVRVVMSRPSEEASARPGSNKSDRLFRKASDEGMSGAEYTEALSAIDHLRTRATSTLHSPTSALHSPAMTYQTSVYHSATSLPLPSVLVDGMDLPRGSTDTGYSSSFAQQLSGGPIVQQHTPKATESRSHDHEHRERARKIYEGNEDDVVRLEAAAWLGENNTLSTQTLHAYMQLFDFTNKNLLSSLRTLCSKLLLRGETQQFDRIITELSTRWCTCNPHHGFKAEDVVHTIFYSLILLNTDLHMADIAERMSKTAYVKNTLPTIRRVAADAAPNAFKDTIKPSQSLPSQSSPSRSSPRPAVPWVESYASGPASPTLPDTPDRTSFETQRPNANKRLSLRPGMFRSESEGWTPDSAGSSSSNALVGQASAGPLRAWELEVESILKSFYTSIRTEPLPLLSSSVISELPASHQNLSVANTLKRSGSIVSKAPSDVSFRSKPGFRAMATGWQNRTNRSRPTLHPASTVASSRTSFDDGNSVWSPTQSSLWSKNSFTRTSASVTSLGYHQSPPSALDYKHSIGFANALSQAIIREESSGVGDGESISVPDGLLDDEALALEGAPWAKEGLVKHKHHMETPDRKAKDRNWTDCFAVISKGKLTIFAFGTASKSHSHSMGRKTLQKHHVGGRAASVTPSKVGGGDWMENAEQLESFVLRQTIASTLPPPGYSKARPHCWALSLPSGAVHLFQVGTPEIAEEFKSSANYWSARLSKEPLSGGVSNIEYGWSEQVINPALLDRTESVSSPPGSMQVSYQKCIDLGTVSPAKMESYHKT